MTILKLWPTCVSIKENFLPAAEHLKLRTFVNDEFIRQGTHPLINWDHTNLPDRMSVFSTFMFAAFHEYCVESGLDIELFELGNIQCHSVPKYNKKMSHEHIMEPHHDLGEGAYVAMVYYVDFDEDETEEHFVGGELTLYNELSSMEYPEGIIHIQPKENKVSFFPARVVHRVKPYFGNKPRITIAALFNKEKSHVQNKVIKTY